MVSTLDLSSENQLAAFLKNSFGTRLLLSSSYSASPRLLPTHVLNGYKQVFLDEIYQNAVG